MHIFADMKHTLMHTRTVLLQAPAELLFGLKEIYFRSNLKKHVIHFCTQVCWLRWGADDGREGEMKKERGDWKKRRVLEGEIMETDEGSGEEECGGMKWSNTLNLILLFM